MTEFNEIILLLILWLSTPFYADPKFFTNIMIETVIIIKYLGSLVVTLIFFLLIYINIFRHILYFNCHLIYIPI
jgi:hypothetical protein